MRSKATNVDDYLAALDEPRRAVLTDLRNAILAGCPDASESMKYGHPHYDLNGPLFAIGSQKHHLALYVAETDAVAEYVKATQRRSTGKGCIRFTISHPIEPEWLPRIIQTATRLRLSHPRPVRFGSL